MKPAHMLVLVSCVVLACGGGCFQPKPVSHCAPAPAPAVTTPEAKPAEQPAQAQAPATETTEATVVVQAPAEKR